MPTYESRCRRCGARHDYIAAVQARRDRAPRCFCGEPTTPAYSAPRIVLVAFGQDATPVIRAGDLAQHRRDEARRREKHRAFANGEG